MQHDSTGSISVDVVATKADLRALSKFVSKRNGMRASTNVRVMAIAVVLVAFGLMTAGVLVDRDNVGAQLVFVGAIIAILVPAQIDRRLRISVQAASSFDGRYTISAEGLTIERPESLALIRFSGIRAAAHTAERILICTGRCSGAAVPRRCCPDEATYEAFHAALEGGIARVSSEPDARP